MNSNDPFICHILTNIRQQKNSYEEQSAIIQDIQMAFDFHLINFFEYESLLVELLCPAQQQINPS